MFSLTEQDSGLWKQNLLKHRENMQTQKKSPAWELNPYLFCYEVTVQLLWHDCPLHIYYSCPGHCILLIYSVLYLREHSTAETSHVFIFHICLLVCRSKTQLSALPLSLSPRQHWYNIEMNTVNRTKGHEFRWKVWCKYQNKNVFLN